MAERAELKEKCSEPEFRCPQCFQPEVASKSVGNDASQMQGGFSGEQMMGRAPPLAPGVCASCDKRGLIARQPH